MRFILPVVFLAAIAAQTDRAVPAFPGAEGFGANARGGRGGKVLLVTNLNDSGPGSFREACQTKGPRIVVFRTGGTIDLKSALHVTEPYITIAGQTAPGDGICLRGNEFTVDAHDVVIRHMRVRPGDISGKPVDAMSIGGNSRDVIVDHCSTSWSVDELLSTSGAISNITVQWCLIGESLNRSVHPKGPHGYGSLVRATGGATFHHNLWSHNTARNPRLGDNYGKPPFPTFDVRNNVMYDYSGMCSGMTGDHLSANYVANYIRPGPSSNKQRGIIVLTDTAEVQYYLSGNIVEGRADLTHDNSKLFDRVELKGRRLATALQRPFDAPAVQATTAEKALEAVLENVGANRPVRDPVDLRLIKQVRDRTGKIVDSQKEVGGWPVYRGGQAPLDTDHDGMPDEWERKHGLNPRDPSDAALDRDKDGYTNIEEYINSLTDRQPGE